MALHATAERFWDWFADNSDRIRTELPQRPQEVGDQIGERFRAAYPQLVWEIGPRGGEPWEFCISAEGNTELFAAVERAVAEAPELSGWEVVAFRQRGELEGMRIQFGEDVTLGPEDIWWAAEDGEDGLSVTLWIRGLDEETDEAYSQAAVILLDHALGEYDSVTMIGELNRGPLPDDPEGLDGLHPLTELPSYIDSLKEPND